MKLMKKVAAVAMAVTLTVTSVQVAAPVTADAQVAYETEKVYISTDLVPEDEGKISISNDGSVPVINSITNVQFDLDCNVDCTWEVAPSKNITGVEGTSTDNVKIDSMGHVTIAEKATKGTYEVQAIAKNIKNENEKTALCKINVDGTANPATATEIKLDKEAIEAQAPKDVIVVAKDGKSMTVNGNVEKIKLYTDVEPSYLLESDVNFESQNEHSAIIEPAGDGTDSLFSTVAASKATSLYAKAGIDKASTEFPVEIKECKYFAEVNCDNIPAGDIKSATKYDVRLNEDLDFYIDDNVANALPKVTTDHVKWILSYGDSDIIATSQEDKSIETALGTFTISEKGMNVNLKTPVVNKDSEEYKAYMEQLKKNAQIKLSAHVPKTESGVGSNSTTDYEVSQITLSFSDVVNSISNIGLDFEKAGLVENEDYAVKKEVLNKKEVPVYYFESGDEDDNVIDLVAATYADVSGVRDFEEAKELNFLGSNVNYKVTYILSDLEDSTFGSAETTAKYMNNGLNSDEIDKTGEVKENCTLTKQGIGYKLLTVRAKGTGTKEYTAQQYVLRFVSDANNMEIHHTTYDKNTDLEYSNEAVVHVRQGEADMPKVFLPNENQEMIEKNINIYDPFLEYTFENIKGEGNLASATTDATTSTLKINALKEGKIVVTASSIVDKDEKVSYVLYINNEVYTPDSIQIDTTNAESLGMMDADGNVKGHYEDIPLGIRANGDSAGIPMVTWESSDPSFATVTEDGKVTTLKSTGQKTVTITAKSISDSSISDSIELHIMEVNATKVKTIAEKVADGEEAFVTSAGDNAGTCKAYTTFTLYAKDYEPINATKADGEITWESTKPEVATIDENGVVTALSEGSTVITACYASGTSEIERTTYNLTVKGFAEVVDSIECVASISLSRVGMTETLVPVVKPDNAVNKAVKYESKDKTIATVTDSGVVTAVAPGTTTIVITSVAKPSVKAEVQVIVAGLPDTTPNPSGTPVPTQTPVVNTPSPTPVVQVTPAPEVTTTVTTSDSQTVKKPVIKLSKKTIKRKKTATIKITNKAKNAKVTYKLDKKSKKIVSVSKKGKITGKKKGKASITVTVVQNGKTYKKKLTIKVK